LEHLWKGQGPESEDAEEEDVEGPEEDDEGVEVVLEAGEEERLDCLPYVQGRGNCTDNPHEKVEVCAKEDGQRSQGQEAREALFWADKRRKCEVETIGHEHLEKGMGWNEVSMVKVQVAGGDSDKTLLHDWRCKLHVSKSA